MSESSACSMPRLVHGGTAAPLIGSFWSSFPMKLAACVAGLKLQQAGDPLCSLYAERGAFFKEEIGFLVQQWPQPPAPPTAPPTGSASFPPFRNNRGVGGRRSNATWANSLCESLPCGDREAPQECCVHKCVCALQPFPQYTAYQSSKSSSADAAKWRGYLLDSRYTHILWNVCSCWLAKLSLQDTLAFD